MPLLIPRAPMIGKPSLEESGPGANQPLESGPAHGPTRRIVPAALSLSPGLWQSQVLFNFHRAAAARQVVVVSWRVSSTALNLHQAGVRSVLAWIGSALY